MVPVASQASGHGRGRDQEIMTRRWGRDEWLVAACLDPHAPHGDTRGADACWCGFVACFYGRNAMLFFVFSYLVLLVSFAGNLPQT